MRLLMFENGNGPRLGALAAGSSDTVIDLTELAKASGSTPPPADLMALIDSGAAGMDSCKHLLAKLEKSASEPITLKLEKVRLLAPLDPPRGNVIAIGRNYAKHAAETAAKGETPKPPTVFSKAITSITGPNDDIPIDPGVSEEIDWEVELGVIIGKAGINITKENALEHVFGYTVINDVTARDIQSDWGGQYFKGKSLDASCPSGPWVVTPDEVDDPQALYLKLTVNGTVKQDGTTSEMIHPVDSIISWVSVGMTLLPGMMIATGTPDGVGFARKPPEFIHVGDMVEAEVQGIGTLRNKFVASRNPRRMD
jgi:2-keto-4-pentenoate hydratase/2-oxohepta-3-ene-1,7-dioic acid hydratase in catechol pathway